jgi:hypothetical protein
MPRRVNEGNTKKSEVKFTKHHEEKFLEFAIFLNLNEEEVIDFSVGILVEYTRSLKEEKLFCAFPKNNPEGKYYVVNLSDLLDVESLDLSEINPEDTKYFITDFLEIIGNNSPLFFDIIITLTDFYIRHLKKGNNFGLYSQKTNTMDQIVFEDSALN